MIASKISRVARPCLRQASRQFSNTPSKFTRIQDIRPKLKEVIRFASSSPSQIIEIPIPPRPAPQEPPMPMPKPPVEPKPKPKPQPQPQHRPVPTVWSTFTGGPGYPLTIEDIPLPPPPSQPLMVNLRSLHDTLYTKEERRPLPRNIPGDMSLSDKGTVKTKKDDSMVFSKSRDE